ncbi:potassium-transporting ATPase subunit B [Streptomyces spiroverticillatus]|uniref:Potassium-transporting ATPase subunit B n=1 Tax=Streptomyces finlayi TaxID=67296 RepID=A0A919CEK7_9ACTN|nr:PP2C family protein-serine/threonine phosphatase [Streptomyces finlayi]GHA30176.1 potassium-transporting ATPase subunit B [Streptomyces spiroverticillatus]GHD15040.1 potassium-transporting ATPase subunit B [Streptomyces finlayi]
MTAGEPPVRTGASWNTLASLRQETRRLATFYRLPSETVARLVLTVSTLAANTLREGGSVTLDTATDAAAPASAGHVRLTLAGLCAGSEPVQVELPLLPLPPTHTLPHSVSWQLPLPDRSGPFLPAPRPGLPSGPDADSDAEAYETELRAALARLDRLAHQQQLLEDELSETNDGVLALYLQLEEREEQLRWAQGQTLLAMEDALRPAAVSVAGLELAVHYAPSDPAAPTGGDLYDWFQLPDGTVHITVVDALGHGIGSTRSALSVTHAVRTLALEGHPLDSIVARVDRQLSPLLPGLQATVLLARLDPGTGALTLAGGSHPPALLLRAHEGTASYLSVRGRGVGYPLPGSDLLRHETLAPGDLLVLYTDGLTESRRDPIDGEARLITAARKHAARPLREIPAAIAADMHTVVLHADDTLALALRRTPSHRSGPGQ